MKILKCMFLTRDHIAWMVWFTVVSKENNCWNLRLSVQESRLTWNLVLWKHFAYPHVSLPNFLTFNFSLTNRDYVSSVCQSICLSVTLLHLKACLCQWHMCSLEHSSSYEGLHPCHVFSKSKETLHINTISRALNGKCARCFQLTCTVRSHMWINIV